MLTSRYPHQCVPGHEYPLPAGMPTVADVFNENGYKTAYFGKWHLGGFRESQGRAAFFITDPDRRGNFQTWIGYENNNSQWDTWVHGGSGKDAFHYRLPGYETDAGSDGMFRKTNPYEESIRTPKVITGGQPVYGKWKPGRKPVLSNHVDIAPTSLGLCGIPKPAWMQGPDYSHHRIKNPAGPEPDSAYLQQVVSPGHPDSTNVPCRGIVTKDGWKLICVENFTWMLFNLNEDPYEESN